MIISKKTSSEAETRAFAKKLVGVFGPKALYALRGDLGAGKT